MISFNEYTLSNGLVLIVHEDHTTPMAAVNILYNVGARDEDPHRTGFAHLFEHLMFGGSIHIPSYDEPLERAGGENNAFTSNDITNYYLSLPAENLETAFWLESDRMLNLAFSEKSLEVQRSVVMEEFKQRYLNQPYGDVFLLLRPLAYQTHPYQWPTIGKELRHIADAQMEEVKAFYHKFYNPCNAIMAVSGDVHGDDVYALAEKWFGSIPSGSPYHRRLPQEPKQQQQARLTVEREVPSNALYMAWHMPGRLDKRYHRTDLISDILSHGESSRFTQKLVKEQPYFTELNAYITGDLDPGLFIISGKPNEGVSFEEAEAVILKELELLKSTPPPERELQKMKHKIESILLFSELKITTIALNLCIARLMGDTNLINTELERYLEVTPTMISEQAQALFTPENSSILRYQSQKESK
ncbi:MAG: peptidase M16 [Bacteroidetes bacterium]|nr:MAG: peptidase M16 [Bacteroidota bacterium]PIE88420.1 MAG: peptidase M16 [Bacteroidota bacterium]